MTLTEIQRKHKSEIYNYIALTGNNKKESKKFIIYIALIIIPPIISILISFNIIVFVITIILSLSLAFAFLYRWRREMDKTFIKKFNDKYDLKIATKRVSKEVIETVQKIKIKDVLSENIYNDKYMNKLKGLLEEEISISKKDFTTINLPLFNVITSVITAIIVVYFINPVKNVQDTDALLKIALSILGSYLYILFIYFGFKFIIESAINNTHKRQKGLLRLINHLELDLLREENKKT